MARVEFDARVRALVEAALGASEARVLKNTQKEELRRLAEEVQAVVLAAGLAGPEVSETPTVENPATGGYAVLIEDLDAQGWRELSALYEGLPNALRQAIHMAEEHGCEHVRVVREVPLTWGLSCRPAGSPEENAVHGELASLEGFVEIGDDEDVAWDEEDSDPV